VWRGGSIEEILVESGCTPPPSMCTAECVLKCVLAAPLAAGKISIEGRGEE
jgi:hypothetical protein